MPTAPTPTPLASYDTESQIRAQQFVSQSTGSPVTWQRSVKVTATRHVFALLSDAEAYLLSVMAAATQDDKHKTDGVCRRVNDVGWAECVVSTIERSDWAPVEDD